MASIARQSPLLRQTCLSAFRSPLATKNVSQAVAFHASTKKQILPPLPREYPDWLDDRIWWKGLF